MELNLISANSVSHSYIESLVSKMSPLNEFKAYYTT